MMVNWIRVIELNYELCILSYSTITTNDIGFTNGSHYTHVKPKLRESLRNFSSYPETKLQILI